MQSPKRKPRPIEPNKDPKPLAQPKKYVSFSPRDSWAIEQAFQRVAEGDNVAAQENPSSSETGHTRPQKSGPSKNTSINDSTNVEKGGPVKVPVNEDYLFDVDVERRELAPAYWLGPIYDVRRGSWFYQEGSTLRPCEENLASQLEEGYLKIKPWRTSPASQTSPTPNSGVGEEGQNLKDEPGEATETLENGKNERSIPAKFEVQTQRLFGTYMSSVVTYQDASTAWILTDDFLSRMSSTVFQRFAGGGHLGGTKIIRGFSEAHRERKDAKKDTATTNKIDNAKTAVDELRIPSSMSKNPAVIVDADTTKDDEAEPEPRLKTLERKMSNFVSSPTKDLAQEEAMARKRDEDEIRQDYVDEDGQDQNREIEHLILVVSNMGFNQ